MKAELKSVIFGYLAYVGLTAIGNSTLLQLSMPCWVPLILLGVLLGTSGHVLYWAYTQIKQAKPR